MFLTSAVPLQNKGWRHTLPLFPHFEVVSVSRSADVDPAGYLGQICDCCGCVIDEELKRCPALDEGGVSPVSRAAHSWEPSDDLGDPVGGSSTLSMPGDWDLSIPWKGAQTERDSGGPINDAERMVYLSGGDSPHRVTWALKGRTLVDDCDWVPSVPYFSTSKPPLSSSVSSLMCSCSVESRCPSGISASDSSSVGSALAPELNCWTHISYNSRTG